MLVTGAARGICYSFLLLKLLKIFHYMEITFAGTTKAHVSIFTVVWLPLYPGSIVSLVACGVRCK